MKMVEKGAPQLVRQKDGSHRLVVPVDFEFDDDVERQEVEDAFRAAIQERIARIRRERGLPPG